MNAANLRLVAIRNLEVAGDVADQALDSAADHAGDVVDTVVDSEASKSIVDSVLDTLSNKFVIGGLVAVAAAGTAYGIYRWMKKDDKPAVKTPAPVAPAAPEMTTEDMVLKARELLTTAETRLKDSKKDTPANATAKAA